MTDRELLELAAKAEGHGVEFDELSGLTFWDSKSVGILWNPLHSDGDALRLAVKLRMEILVGEIRISVYSDWTVEKCEMYPADHLATTRRLIVEAAAEIGKTMP